jgi:hypothetical protein
VPISDFDVLVHKQEYYRGRHTSAKTGIVHVNVLGGTGMVQMDILIQEKEGTAVGTGKGEETTQLQVPSIRAGTIQLDIMVLEQKRYSCRYWYMNRIVGWKYWYRSGNGTEGSTATSAGKAQMNAVVQKQEQDKLRYWYWWWKG